jgi:hypothetical protein
MHNVFHVSLLELYQRRLGEKQEIVQPDLIDREEQWKVHSVLDRRVLRREEQFLIRWEGFGPADDSWEPVNNLSDCDQGIEDLRKRRRNAAQPPAKRKPAYTRRTAKTKRTS